MKVALAYSGGLDTSAIIPWLRENHACEVVAIVGDVGQGADELEGVEAKALATGASACHVVDLRAEFVEQYVFPTLITGAVYEERYLLGTAMARPILAKAQVDVALRTGCTALAHGCTGKGNDQVRFEATYAVLAPNLDVIAPWRTWNMSSRSDLLAYLAERGIPCAASVEKIYSRDANLWHVSHEGGDLEDPWMAPPDDIWLLTNDVESSPPEPAVVTIGFEKGRPRTLDGKSLPAVDLLEQLNALAGTHGVGRIDLVESRVVGMKSRGCYETPGGTVLLEALRSLQELALDHETRLLLHELGARFAEIVYRGQWFTTARAAIAAAAETIACNLTGEVAVKLHRGHATPIQRRTPNSLYAPEFATFEADAVYDQADAAGFIRLFTLPMRVEALAGLQTATPQPETVA